ncbi:hypothetical protein [Streptomyces rhizosphaericus]|uniref:Uncharacterized protein n=1 Tax=Streptomyces rhizosphaericus TaxID=114699 RepID=A0A6G4ARQ0_9ACTN|nr:hypothetical protein [Streptomyces rhizosphaericus]NEW75454.1 hypothetical protein [Streptomyces rhizosphaericus]
MPENTHAPVETFPPLIGAQVEPHAAAVRQNTYTEVAAMLRHDGLPMSAGLVEAHRDLTSLDRPEQRAEFAREVRRAVRAAALCPLLDALAPQTLTDIRETVADAEEAAWRRVVARRMRALAPRYEVAVFTAVETKLGQGHDDYSTNDVELYAPGQDDPNETVDLDDASLTRALGALAELLHPEEGARLTINLDAGGRTD